jgi:hypothetical protein
VKAKGGCHCGKVRFEAEVDITKGLACNCSICSKRGSILAFVPEDQFKLLSGADAQTEYLFNKHKIRHFFCKTCGILSFATSNMQDGQKMRAINLRSIDGIDIEKINIQMYDGKSI